MSTSTAPRVIRKSEIEVRTHAYEFEHGKRPGGRGSWAFEIGRDPQNPFWFNGVYRAAKAAAIAEAVRRGEYHVTVLT